MAEKENKLFEGKGEGGRWVTINGAHVFVDEGQSVEDAMQATFNKNPKHDATRAKMAENNKQILENTKNINSKNSWEMSNKNIELYLQNKNHLAEIEGDVETPNLKVDEDYEAMKKHILGMSEKDRASFKKNYYDPVLRDNPIAIDHKKVFIKHSNASPAEKQRVQKQIDILEKELKEAKLANQILEELKTNK